MTEREHQKLCYRLLKYSYPQLVSGIKESIKIGMSEAHFRAQQCSVEGRIGSEVIMGAYHYAKRRLAKKMKKAA